MTGLCASPTHSNPYEPIVTRNIFNLNPPQASTAPPPAEPPVKIKPDGIMTIFGTPQVLFYADTPPRPPLPASHKSYILSEGQQQDGIEVKHIDQKNNIITFSNHGAIQEIPLAKAAPITMPTPVVMRTGYVPPPAPGISGYKPGGGNAAAVAARFGPNRNFGTAARNFGNQGNPGYTGGNIGNQGNISPQQQLTPEEQMIMIAAQHAEAQKRGDPTANLFPHTPLDEAAGVTPNTAQSPVK